MSADLRALHQIGGRQADDFYRDRWSHDKVVRSTHGVNCTGSCSWKVYVKDGIITWESQQTDYPSVGPGQPGVRAARLPARRRLLLVHLLAHPGALPLRARRAAGDVPRGEGARIGDPVLAWAEIVDDPERSPRYKRGPRQGRPRPRVVGRGDRDRRGRARPHDQAVRPGPGRRASRRSRRCRWCRTRPAPASSRCIGGSMLSFYDWYADLPVASPQVFGDQTDVPESGDWWDAGYLIMWGSNVPVTRTPDAHWMTEARYRGQKVVAVSPDYADNVKFADEWLAAAARHRRRAGDGDGARRSLQGVLRRPAGALLHRLREEVHRPAVPGRARASATAATTPASSSPRPTSRASSRGGARAVQDGAARLGDRRAGRAERLARLPVRRRTVPGRWNLDLGEVDPLLTLPPAARRRRSTVELPRFDAPTARPRVAAPRRAGPPGRRPPRHDRLRPAAGAVRRRAATGCPGIWPTGYDDADAAVHAGLAGDRSPACRPRRPSGSAASSPPTPRSPRGRSMILMGAGTNHWFHSDTIYRAFLALTTLTGCQGVNGGGWAHYVGQEKCRPVTGWAQLAFGAGLVPAAAADDPDGVLVPAHRPVALRPASAPTRCRRPPAHGQLAGKTTADIIAQSARMGWMPSYPTFDRNPLTLADDARGGGQAGRRLRRRRAASPAACGSPARTPTAENNFPRVLTVWRANLLGSSGKGNEYFLQHLLGADDVAARRRGAAGGAAARTSCGATRRPTGKLDLLLSLDFRMTSTTIFSDVVLPAATWYEKHDLNTTDMHPFVHSFNPAIAPPWQTRTDFDAFQTIAQRVQPARRDAPRARARTSSPSRCCTTPPTRWRTRTAWSPDWKAGECEPIPGETMPKLVVVERDYAAVGGEDGRARPADRRRSAPPPRASPTTLDREVDYLRRQERRGARRRRRRAAVAGPRRARVRGDPRAVRHHQRAPRDAGLPARWRSAPGSRLADLAAEHEGKQITFADTQARPVPVITSPEWSGSETGGRRYSPFTINVERLKPWHTLTGRQHFFLDHDWMTELGEGLPIFRPPLNMHGAVRRAAASASTGELGLTVRYLTPHSKWSIHSEYQDNLFMLQPVPRRADDLDEPGRTRPRSACTTTTGSRRSTATASSSPARSSRTGCPRAPCTCTTRRTG